MEIYREKAFHAGKKIRKNDFAPLWKIFLLCPYTLLLVHTRGMRLQRGTAEMHYDVMSILKVG